MNTISEISPQVTYFSVKTIKLRENMTAEVKGHLKHMTGQQDQSLYYKSSWFPDTLIGALDILNGTTLTRGLPDCECVQGGWYCAHQLMKTR